MSQLKATRREFLSAAVGGAALLAMNPPAGAGEDKPTPGEVPRRPFGRSGQTVSLLCVGGFHIGVCPEGEAIRLIQEAVDAGANFVDNAWEYHNGMSEERVGKALKGGRRDKTFVMTKHHGRDRKTALKHLEDSLRRLQTDHVDLWQFHEIVYDDDPDMIFAPDGGIEAADLARKQGKARYIGFTGHKKPEQLLKMLAYGYPWDAVQMPLNPLDGSFQSFEKWVLPVLVKRGIAPLAMKTRGGGFLLRSGAVTAEECWRYVTGLPVASVVSGMDSLDMLHRNLKMARELKAMSKEEMEAIRKRTAEAAAAGKHEPYKTSRMFDGQAGRALHHVPS